MKILDLTLTDGPNYWSVTRHQLVVMTLDLEELEEKPTNKIPGFYQRLQQLLPSLQQHRCSEGMAGGFFQRVERGTWMGHVIEHIALEIQTLAGIETGFGRTRGAGKKGVYHVVFSCQEPESGRHAASAAIRIVEDLIANRGHDLAADIAPLRLLYQKNKLGPSTKAIVDAAGKRNIPVLRLNNGSFIQLGYGAAQRRIEAAVADSTSHIAVTIAGDKYATKSLLTANNIPVPEGGITSDTAELPSLINRIGYPIVIKPRDGNHGKGATTNIMDEVSAQVAFERAQRYAQDVIVEKFAEGFDFRILVVNYKLVAAALRTAPSITGDGRRTIRELVEDINRDPRRGSGHENVLTKILIDDATQGLLAQRGLNGVSVLAAGEQVVLKPTANLSTGGTATDVTNQVHPANAALLERVAAVIGLDICGIDVITPDLRVPLNENGGVVLEVNAGPGLRMHLHPSRGQQRDVATPIIDMLFPEEQDGRIPIIAVTGTNGKTTTTRLIAHIMREAGYNTGYTTTEGVYIGKQMIEKGDCTGPRSARMVLQDRSVNCAVLECARGGILRGGLGFDQCDTAVLTNIAEDHIGLKGIDSIEKLARVKAVVTESVAVTGSAVLNADDDRVYEIGKRLSCELILFSMQPGRKRIREHMQNGGTAVICENGTLSIISDGAKIQLGPVRDVPVTFSGNAHFNIANTLAATAAAFSRGIRPAFIYQALLSFIPSDETLPGRMNIFDFGQFKVVVDYAHNIHGLQCVGPFIKSMPAIRRIGVITGIGDRREEDIFSLGYECARVFDEIIIRHDADLRGRSGNELNDLVCRGIWKADPSKKVSIIPDEKEAVRAVIAQADAGTLAVVFADDVHGVIETVRQAMPKEDAIQWPQRNPDQPTNAAA